MGRPKNFEPDEVVARAMDVFWTKGYACTSPADLAEATGVGKGSLYHTFGSKRDLFGKALEYYGRTGAEITEKFLFEPGTTAERIRAYLEFVVEVDLSHPVPRGCLAANTAMELGGRDEEATRTVHRIEDQTIALFTARIEQGRRDGDVDESVDALAQAQFLMNTVVGLRVMAKTYGESTLRRIIDTALAGL